MQSCIVLRRASAVCQRPCARRPLPLLRPVRLNSSVSTPTEPAQNGKETEPDKQEGPKGPEESEHQQDAKVPEQVLSAGVSASETPSTSDTESTAVVALLAEPSASSSATEGEEGEAEEAPQSSFTSHPLEDLPEEEDLIASKELMAEMMDSTQLGRRGEHWLFAQLAAMAMLLFPPLTLKGLVDFCATLSLTSGLVFVLTALVHLGRNLSPLPEPRKKHELVVSGIYGYVRHPMYGGLLLAAFGLAVLTRNETRLAICALLWWVLESKVAVEERALSERYPTYAEYKTKVKKFLPFIY